MYGLDGFRLVPVDDATCRKYRIVEKVSLGLVDVDVHPVAAMKHEIPDFRDTVRNGNLGKILTVLERPVPDFCYSTGNSDAG